MTIQFSPRFQGLHALIQSNRDNQTAQPYQKLLQTIKNLSDYAGEVSPYIAVPPDKKIHFYSTSTGNEAAFKDAVDTYLNTNASLPKEQQGPTIEYKEETGAPLPISILKAMVGSIQPGLFTQEERIDFISKLLNPEIDPQRRWNAWQFIKNVFTPPKN